MIKTSRVVPATSPHKHNKGDVMDTKKEKIAETIKLGNTTIHFIEPPPLTEEEKEQILKDYHNAGWAIIEEMVERGEEV